MGYDRVQLNPVMNTDKMFDKRASKLAWAVNLLMASVLAFSLIIPNSRGAAVLALFLMSLMHIWKPVKFKLHWTEKLWLFFLFSFFCSSMLSFFMNDFSAFQMSYLEKPARCLLLIPVFLLLKKVELNELLFYLSAAIGAFSAGVFATYQHYVLSMPNAMGGANHHIVFGDIAICLSIISLVGLIEHKYRSALFRGVLFLGFWGGLTASLFSGARGGWISIPGMVIIFLWIYRARLGVYKISFFLIAIILSFAVLYQSTDTGVSRRVDAAISNVKDYYQHGTYQSSLGQRLEMFKAAWIMFQQKPWFGFGPGSFIREANRLEREGEVNPIFDTLAHPHNEFLDEMSSRGLVGLLVLLSIYLFPVIYFSKQFSRSSSSLALLGVLIPVLYMIFSLSESMLDRVHSLVFFLIVMFYILALFHQRTGYGKETSVN